MIWPRWFAIGFASVTLGTSNIIAQQAVQPEMPGLQQAVPDVPPQKPSLPVVGLQQAVQPEMPGLQRGIPDVPAKTPSVPIVIVDEQSVEPGIIAVIFKPDVSSSQMDEFQKAFGLRPLHTSSKNSEGELPTRSYNRQEMIDGQPATKSHVKRGTVDGQPSTNSYAHQYKVDVGSEQFWVTALAPNPLIATISGVPIRLAAAGDIHVVVKSSQRPFAVAKTRMLGEVGRLPPRPRPLDDPIFSFLQGFYSSKHAICSRLRSNSNELAVHVTGLHGEVTQISTYWEQFDSLDIIFFVGFDHVFHLAVNLKGAFAATSGPNPPSNDFFVNYDPKYLREEQIYTDTLSTSLLMHLRSIGALHD